MVMIGRQILRTILRNIGQLGEKQGWEWNCNNVYLNKVLFLLHVFHKEAHAVWNRVISQLSWDRGLKEERPWERGWVPL